MKRLFIVASMAIMAVGCQKTTVENEVLTPIGFDTEVGKQTRAIVDNAYDQEESFGVYSFAWQNGAVLNTVMDDETISKRETTAEGATEKTYAWKAASTYYWPNDSETSINFYAYSPKSIEAKMTKETEGTLTLTYAHTQEKINSLDFMVATPVKKATFAKPYGENEATEAKGVVPVKFHHQMTQVQFVVKSTMPSGATVNFGLVSIDFANVTNAATYEQKYTTNYGAWTSTDTGSYSIYAAPKAEGATEATPETISATGISTTPATMIPQDLDAQTFTVKYTVGGTGVAKETVTKTLNLKAGSLTKWTANKKVIYTLTIGLQEITFTPSVENWDSTVDTPGEDIDITNK